MAKNYHPKDQFLRSLVEGFENSVQENNNQFFLEDELERLMDFYESVPDIKKALLVANRAVQLFPYSGAFHCKCAQFLIMLKQYDEARDALEQARVFDPMSSEIVLLEADLFTAEGKYNQSIERLEQLYDMVSMNDRADVLLELADVYEISNNRDEFVAILKRVLKDYPQNEEAIHRLWQTIQLYNVEDEIPFFLQLIDKRPYHFLAWYYLAKAYEHIGLYEKAVDAYQYTIAINEYYLGHWDYAKCLKKMKNYEEAILAFQDFIETFSEEYDAYMQLGHCYRLANNYSHARKAYTRAMEFTDTPKERAECHYFSGKTFEAEDQNTLALSQFKKAIELKTNRSKYWRALGDLYFKLEQFEEAEDSFSQCLHIDTKQPKVWKKLAELFSMTEKREELLNLAQQAMEFCPNQAALKYAMAGQLITNGYLQYGLLLLQDALILDSTKKNSIFATFPELMENKHVIQLLESYS